MLVRSKVSGFVKGNLVGFLALFVALGGSAYAVNTVNSTDIVDGQVKSVDVGDGEVKSADVKDQSLTTFDVSTFLGADIVDGTITGSDIGDEAITGSDIAYRGIGNQDIDFGAVNGLSIADDSISRFQVDDGSLTAKDVGENVYLDFPATTPAIPATSCTSIPITGIAANFDHMVLTPSSADASLLLTYQIEYNPGDSNATLRVCNPTFLNETARVTHFNLIVFQH